MAYHPNDLAHFQQLRDQAARKRELEARRAQLLPQQEALAAQAQACRKARQEAEAEVEELTAGGAKGFLYTIAGGKAQRQVRAQEVLREAKAKDQQAAWDLAQVQADLAQTERELEELAGTEEALAEARKRQTQAIQSAQLPQRQALLSLAEALTQQAALMEAITALQAQCQAALETAEGASRLADRSVWGRDFDTIDALQWATDQALQQQQDLEGALAALLAQAETLRLSLEQAQDDVLSQPLPLGASWETDPL